MGSKGSNTTTTNQTQTYQPNQQAASAITGALGQAQSAAQLPFNIPQAPVAGFSQDQQNAFGLVNNAQGMAQPYYNQASNLFNQSAQAPDISQFFNPYASAVTSQMNNIFGQQQSQNNGSLVQSAGGVGADRIAVGQGNLANQQGLAAGQTLASLYAPSLQAAQQQQNIQQGAAYGQASLGSAAQNSALSGANALLGTGGLQQQLSQAQLNAPYQQQLAQAAFPYQQSQFLTGAVGSLAPGLGGTTSGQGQTTTPAPSMLSQILGLGTAGVGLAGGMGAFSPTSAYNPFGSSPAYGGGNAFSGDAYGGSSTNPAPGLTAADYGTGYADGGDVDDHPYRVAGDVIDKSKFFEGISRSNRYQNSGGFRLGTPSAPVIPIKSAAGGGIPNDEPINIDQQSIIPTGKTTAIQPHIPQLNLSTQAPAQQNSGANAGQAIASAAKIAAMFAKRGGRIDPYAEGGEVDNGIDISDHSEAPYSLGQTMAYARAKQDTAEVERGERFSDNGSRIPGRQKARNDAYTAGLRRRSYADGGDTDIINPDEPYRLAGPDAMKAWRKGVAEDIGAGQSQQPVIAPADSAPAAAMAFAGKPAAASALPPEIASGASNPYVGTPAPQEVTTSSPGTAAAPEKEAKFVDSPWAALMAAGLGIAGGTSPFAGVNIGQGGLQGLKTLEEQKAAGQKDETIKQAAKRLEQEAKFHEDQFTRLTMGQKQAQQQADRPYQELTAAEKQSGDLAKARDERADKQFNRPYEELTAIQKATVDRQKEQDDLAERRFNRPYEELTKQEQAQLEESKRQHELSRIPIGMRRNAEGNLEAEPGGPHDPETIRREAEAKRPPGMNDEALEPLVDSYMKGNTGVLSGVGRGTQGAQNLEKFWSMMAAKLKDRGMTGADLAAARANFMGQSAGLRVAAQREANIETAVNEAKGTFPLVLRASEALPRTDFPLINTAIQAYRTNTGSPEQRKYGASIQAAVTAYSQAMSRTGANSVYAQSHAEALLNKVDGPDALKATIEQLDAEMAIAQHAPEQTRQSIINRILGVENKQPAAAGATPAAAPAVARPASLPEGSQYSASRKQWRTPDGKLFDVSGNPVP